MRPLYLEVFYGDLRLANATCFSWKDNDSAHLITNWHVVSGRHPDTGQPLTEHAGVPDRMEVFLHREGRLGAWARHSVPLWDRQGRPIWLEHPQHAGKVDVVAVPFACPNGLTDYPLNIVEFTDFRLAVGQDVFILGFPHGMAGGGAFPIWKRGSIASEPGIDFANLPCVLIDSGTRTGMSGAPVIAQFTGWHAEDPERPSLTDWMGTALSFLGVYSARLPGQMEAETQQVGIVWKAAALRDIIAAGVRPR
jgi:hypothetical protein